METPLGKYGQAEVILTTNNPPIAGTFEVRVHLGFAVLCIGLFKRVLQDTQSGVCQQKYKYVT